MSPHRQHVIAALHHSRASDIAVVDYALQEQPDTLRQAIEQTKGLLAALEAESARIATGAFIGPPQGKIVPRRAG